MEIMDAKIGHIMKESTQILKQINVMERKYKNFVNERSKMELKDENYNFFHLMKQNRI